MTVSGAHLVYFADPMCSWCWGFSPSIAAIQASFGEALPIRLVLGGLRPGTTEPMDPKLASSIRGHWKHVNEASGQPFDLAFFDRTGFIYDTEPASRFVAVIRRTKPEAMLDALARVQHAFYAENSDVTKPETLAELAEEFGLEREAFLEQWGSEEMKAETAQDFMLSQRTGVTGFPTLIGGVAPNQPYTLLTQGFQPPEQSLATVFRWLEQSESGS
jgi:putative protein-disulfide isomerase